MGSVLQTPAHKAHKGTTGGMTVDMDVKRLMLMRDMMSENVGLINDLLEPKEPSRAGVMPSYKIGERGQLTMVYKGTELELFKGGKGEEEFDWFVFQVLDEYYDDEFVEEVINEELYRIIDEHNFNQRTCMDILSCALKLVEYYGFDTRSHCKWFIYEPHFRPIGCGYNWLIHEKACELILADNNSTFNSSSKPRDGIGDLDPLKMDKENYYCE